MMYVTLADETATNSITLSQRSHALYRQDQIQLAGGQLQLTFSGRLQLFQLEQPSYVGTTNSPYQGDLCNIDTPNASTGDAALAYFFRGSQTKLRAHVGNSYLSGAELVRAVRRRLRGLLRRHAMGLAAFPPTFDLFTKSDYDTILFGANGRLFVFDGTTKANPALGYACRWMDEKRWRSTRGSRMSSTACRTKTDTSGQEPGPSPA